MDEVVINGEEREKDPPPLRFFHNLLPEDF